VPGTATPDATKVANERRSLRLKLMIWNTGLILGAGGPAIAGLTANWIVRR
jgi:hypothetical protein